VKIGVFYQSTGKKIAACYKAIEQFRKFNPDVPISLWEDGTKDMLKIVAEKLNCTHRNTNSYGENTQGQGRPFVGDINATFKWVDRIHTSVTNDLQDVDYVILYEDDVWCRREIQIFPTLDLEGANGPLHSPELYSYLKEKFGVTDDVSRNHWSRLGSLQSYGACGGTIFSREKFIKCYENFWNIPWDEIYKLDSRCIEWCDNHLSFLFQYNGYTTGIWADWGQYDNRNEGNWFDKTGWCVPMEEQKNAAFLHAYKHFYNYTPEEVGLVI